MNFYVYENWTAESKAVIHIGSCGHCKEGHGCHKTVRGNRNGRWWGKYSTFQEAEEKAISLKRLIRDHRCIR